MPPNEIHKILPIQNSNQGNDIYTFPANGRGFGPKRPSEIYLSDKEHDGHEVVALKYAFYILAGDKPTLHDEYPLIDKLRTETERNPEEFKERLRLGLDQMFRHIIRKVHESIAVGRYPYRIGKACIIIPSRWDLDFEAVYASILGKALNWADAYARDRMLFFFRAGGPSALPALYAALLVGHYRKLWAQRTAVLSGARFRWPQLGRFTKHWNFTAFCR